MALSAAAMRKTHAKTMLQRSARTGTISWPRKRNTPASPAGMSASCAMAASGSTTVHAPRAGPRSSGTMAAPRMSVQAGENSTALIVVLGPLQGAPQTLRRKHQADAGDEAERAMEPEPVLDGEVPVLVHERLHEQEQRADRPHAPVHLAHVGASVQ